MENDKLKTESNNANVLLSAVVVHPHPIVEMQLKNFKRDEVGYIAECVLYNKEFKKVESSFFIDEDRANEIIGLMQMFLNNCL
jgi:hypothetical protein